jgi:hypothetical protein
MAAKNFSASGVLYTDRADFYLNPQITKELWTTVAPFTTMIADKGFSAGLSSPIFKMFEHRSAFVKQYFDNNGISGTIPAASSSSTLTVNIDGIHGLKSTVDNSYIGLELEVWNSTLTTKKGVALVIAAPSTTSLALKSMTATTITVADNDRFYVIGNAFGEGTESPEAWADEIEVVYGSTQIFKTPIEITGTLYEAALRGYSDELSRLRIEKAKEHKIQKERAFLFGAAPMNYRSTFGDSTLVDANGNTVRATNGLVTLLESYGNSSGDDQNVFSCDYATYTYSDFLDDMEKVFQYVPENGNKTAFVSQKILSYFSKLSSNSGFSSGWDITMSKQETDRLGYDIRYLTTPHGTLKLVWNPLFRDARNNLMLIVSEENLELKQYRPMKFQANIKEDNAYDGVKDQYFSDEGLGVTLIESHKLFKFS